MKLINQKIAMYKDALKACDRRKSEGLIVKDDVEWFSNRLKQLKQEKKFS